MPFVIPVFIPHQGCPHNCVFCNQYRITGYTGGGDVSAGEVTEIINCWLARNSGRKREVQVAFYGGSFTGMARARQTELLDAAVPYISSGLVQTIRLSTRPDYIDRETVAFLKSKKVGIVELGIQSLDDEVLAASRRGHTAQHSIKALKLLQEEGILVGAQLMLGLPGQKTKSLIKTARQIASLRPDFVRIYPVLVVRGSILADRFKAGQYRPLSLGAAVVRAAKMKELFDAAGIKVVRMGLQPEPDLEKNLLAGPYHPAFGELVGSRIMLNRTRRLLKEVPDGEQAILTIHEKDQSMFRGIHSANMKRLAELGLYERFILHTSTELHRGCLRKELSLNTKAG